MKCIKSKAAAAIIIIKKDDLMSGKLDMKEPFDPFHWNEYLLDASQMSPLPAESDNMT